MVKGNWILPMVISVTTVLVVHLLISNTSKIRENLPNTFVKEKPLSTNEFQSTDIQNEKLELLEVELKTPQSKLNFTKLCNEDMARVQAVLDFDTNSATINSLTKILARTVSYPVQMGCQMMKRVGRGAWIGKCNDGHKYVCLDDIDSSNCLVYSFGLANQISFEESMANWGCNVFGYDIGNTTMMQRNKNPKLNFKVARIGKGGSQLADLLIENGHENTAITYLKADIEGAEINALPIWIKSGALDNIKQLGFEFHSVDSYINKFWTIIQELYKLGFRVISYDPNFCSVSSGKGFFKLFEIVFRRTNVCS